MRQMLWATSLAVGVMCGGISLGLPGTTHAAYGKTHIVAIHGYKFVPRQLVINAGDRVIWVNKDADQHTVTSYGSARAVLQSRPLSGSARYSMTFSRPGTIPYHCEFHPFMLGTVKVRAHATA